MTVTSCTKDMSEYCFRDRDEFRREPIADKIIALLKNEHADISPLLIDGDWGTGKTEFCHKLINKLKEEVRQQEPHQANTENVVEDVARRQDDTPQPYFKVAYIDAFRADHTGEPLMAIFAAVSKALVPQEEGEKSEKREGFVKLASKVGLLLLKHGGKAMLSHVLKANIDEVGKELTSTLDNAGSEMIDTSFASILKTYEDIDENLEALRELLTELAQDTPLVIFIDELDRCKPDFAVQLIEIIKHIFDVPNIQFVLVTNRSQLHAAIEHCYGSKIQADRYLDKFIKFSLTLPRYKAKNKSLDYDVSVTHFDNISCKNKNINDYLKTTHEGMYRQKKLADIIIRKNLSLRETEIFFRYLNIYETIEPSFLNKYSFVIDLIIINISIYCFDRHLLEKISHRKLTANELAKVFSINTTISPLEISDFEISIVCILQGLINSDEYSPNHFCRSEKWQQCYIDLNDKDLFSAKTFYRHFDEFINTITFRQSC